MMLFRLSAIMFAVTLITVQAQEVPVRGNHSERIHPSLKSLATEKPVNVIVLHPEGAPKGLVARVQRRNGIAIQRHFEQLGQSVARLTRSQIARLADDPEVAFIAPDLPVKAFGTLDRGPESVGAYAALQAGYTGTGIGVAVIDSGVSYMNCDYNTACTGPTRWAGQISFVENLNGSWTAPADGQDYFGHGTHVASILAGDGTFSTSYVNAWGMYPDYWIHGVAIGTNLISIRVLDSGGSGTDSMVIAGINYAISVKDSLKIRVINLSLGRPFTTSYKNDPLCQAVERAWKAGIVVVVAAGNYGRNSPATQGYGTITAPGNDPYVITVGAVNTRGTTDLTQHVVTSYSSKGPTAIDHIAKPDLVAPGNNIYATECQLAANGKLCPLNVTYPANQVTISDFAPGTSGTGFYFRLSGTSMAAPMVAGAAALLLQQNPSLTPDQVKARLMKTATKGYFVPSYTAVDAATGATYLIHHDLFTVGAGELNIMAALKGTDTPPAILPALSPAAVVNGTQVSLVAGQGLVWGTGVVWGSSLVWGTGVVWGTSLSGTAVICPSGVVWGTATLSGMGLVWGTNAIVASTGSAMTNETGSAVLNGDR